MWSSRTSRCFKYQISNRNCEHRTNTLKIATVLRDRTLYTISISSIRYITTMLSQFNPIKSIYSIVFTTKSWLYRYGEAGSSVFDHHSRCYFSLAGWPLFIYQMYMMASEFSFSYGITMLPRSDVTCFTVFCENMSRVNAYKKKCVV